MNFDKIWNIIETIPGWLSEEDARILWNLCDKSNGPFLEVGSFLGKSSIILSNFNKTFCVDHWEAGKLHPRLQKCIYNKTPKDLHNLNFMNLFDFYTKKTPFHYRIKPIKAFDYELFNSWQTKIGFIFLDHLHVQKAVEDSLLGWKSHLTKNAKILVHDANIKEVMKGIKNSKIRIEHLYEESKYVPALCSWPPIY